MKSIDLNLLSSVVPLSAYDKTKTTITGNVNQQTINGIPVLGPPLTKFLDMTTETGGAYFPGAVAATNTSITFTSNNYLYVVLNHTLGVFPIACYSFNQSNGTHQFIGVIKVQLPALNGTVIAQAGVTVVGSNVHLIRFIEVVDSNPANAQIIIGTTVGALGTWFGGLYMVNQVKVKGLDNTSDFNPSSPTFFYSANGSNQKAVYSLQDPLGLGYGTLNVNGNNTGATLHNTSILAQAGIDSSNNRLYVVNGVFNSFTMKSWDLSASATSAGMIAPQYPIVNPTNNSTFTVPGGHPFQAGDPVILQGPNPPGALSFSNNINTQTVYSIATTNLTTTSFELCNATPGVAVTFNALGTLGLSGNNVMRAFGQTSALSVPANKTPLLTTVGLVGAFLTNDAGQVITPPDGPNVGYTSFFIPTVSNFYHFRLSDITTTASNFGSLVPYDNLGSSNSITAPVTVLAQYDSSIGKIVYLTNTFNWLTKHFYNPVLLTGGNQSTDARFGGNSNQWLTNNGSNIYAPQGFKLLSTPLNLCVSNGWIFVPTSYAAVTLGQQGIMCCNLRSDQSFGYSTIISKVVQIDTNASLKTFSLVKQLGSISEHAIISYRVGTSLNDSTFSTAAGGWVSIGVAQSDLSLLNVNAYSFIQFMISFNVFGVSTNIPSQINAAALNYSPANELSDYWSSSFNNSSANGANPTYSAFRLVRSYIGSVPTLYFRAYDDNGNLIAYQNTSTNASNFQTTTNNGTSWTSVSAGPISNTVLTTETRYVWPTPPGVNITCSLKEF